VKYSSIESFNEDRGEQLLNRIDSDRVIVEKKQPASHMYWISQGCNEHAWKRGGTGGNGEIWLRWEVETTWIGNEHAWQIGNTDKGIRALTTEKGHGSYVARLGI